MSECESARAPFFVEGVAGTILPCQAERTAGVIAQRVLAALGAHGCVICTFDRSGHKVRLLAASGSWQSEACSCVEPADPGIAAALRGEWSNWYDSALASRPGQCGAALGLPVASRLVVPLLLEGEPIAITQVLSTTPRQFTADDASKLMGEAAMAALALENARLYDRAGTLFALAKTLSSTLEMGQVGNLIAENVAKAMGAKGCTVRSLDRLAKRLDLVGAYGLSRKYLWEKGPVLAEESIAEALEGKPTAIRDVANDPRVQYPAAAVEEGISSIASIPMVVKGVVTGVLRVYTAQPFDFSPEDVAFLTAAAALAGAALENARLYDGIRHDFEVLMDEIVYMRRAARAVGGSKEAGA